MNNPVFPDAFGSEILKYVKENYLPKRERRFRKTPFCAGDLHSFVPMLKQLHENFTKGRRGRLGGYFRYPEARGAYLLGFYPLILGKLISLFQSSNILNEIKKSGAIEVLDYASGPLTATMALLLLNPELESRISVTAVDIENEIMHDGKRLLQTFFPKIKYIKPGYRLPTDKRFDLILVSHLFNELSQPAKLLPEFPNLTKEDGVVIFIEPATRYSSTILMGFREEVAKNGEWSIIYPCLHGSRCPLLHNSEYGWCHQVRQVTLPPIFKQIRKEARLDPDEAKSSSLVIKRRANLGYQSGLRVLSNPMKTPVKSVVYACTPGKPEEIEIRPGVQLSPGDILH